MLTKVYPFRELEWSVKISWSKNASLPIIAATLLLRGKIRLKNVPHIGDVNTFLDILASIGAKYEFENGHLDIDTTNLDLENIDEEKVKKVRVSLLLLAPILHHFGKLHIPYPGGCSIGKRPIDSHLNMLDRIGYKYTPDENYIHLEGEGIVWDVTLNAGFSVTATENIIVANVLREGKTIINLGAIEPHVMNLINFLRTAGADINIRYDNTITVTWVKELKADFEFDIVHDYIESGTFMVIAALASKEYLDIEHARIEDLYSFIEKLNEAGVKTEDLGNDTLRVYRAKEIKPVTFQTNIFPGFPTDLQSPFCVLLTQAEGISKVNEILFEGRLNFLVELEKMRAHPAILNPHQALIFGPTPLRWATVTSWDLRAWAAMVIAWLIVERGVTKVSNVDYIRRWYEDLFGKLKALGATIED